ncbi:MAG: AAA family ATPase, partial [Streptosporangiaceae bacterium]
MNAMIYAPTPLVGREREFAELRNRVLDPATRMLTVTGPVGVGKSRLVAALFEHVSYEFAHGGRYLDLSAADETADLAETLISALGVTGEDQALPADRLAAHLRDKHFLLVVDGCELVLKPLVPLVTNLVSTCPRLSVLISSPERMGVYGEGLVRLGPLPVPGPTIPKNLTELERIPAVQLFVHRSRAVRPGFVLTEENREAVGRLCQMLDGLPLAIELASARMKLSSPQALLSELESDLGVLSGTRADTMSQHIDLRSAVEWSLSRLKRPEQVFLSRLAIFTGEFGFAAAKGLSKVSATQTQDLLETLVDRNILLTDERPDGELGFRMLGLIRRYALEWLRRTGDYTKVMRGHADYFMAMAQTAETELFGPEQSWWLDQLSYWHHDISAALQFLADSGDGPGLAGLASALRLHWQVHGVPREGVQWLEQALILGELPHHLAPRVHETLGELSLGLGETSVADDCLATARSLFEELRDSSGTASCLRTMGRLAYFKGDLAQADVLLEESATAMRAVGSVWGQAMTLRDLAATRRARGNLRAAWKL